MKETNLIRIKERIKIIKCEWLCSNCKCLNFETYSNDDWSEKRVQCSYCNENFIVKLN